MNAYISKDRIFWALLIFASIYILGNIGAGSLTTWDEAVYANISRNILKTDDWVVMYDGGRPWFDKPPLYMWGTAIFYNIFGINEFSTRLTSGIFGLATVLLVYLFIRKFYNQATALLASMLLLAAPHYLNYAKMGMMDATLTFFITLMIFLFRLGQEKPRYLFWSGITLLFAYLTKGFAAIGGPAAIFLYCLFSKNLRLLVKREFAAGILISIFAIFIWHLSQYLSAGPHAISDYFGFHIFKRTTTALEGHTGGFNFYQKVVFNKNIPWSIIFYPSLLYIVWIAIKDKDKNAALLIAWALAIFTIYTIVKTKLHWYIIPIYPALAISSAVFLERFFKNKALRLILLVILATMLIQIPISRAFKLDFNHDTKAAGQYANMLQNKGAKVYLYKMDDNKEIFYFRDIPLLTGQNTGPGKFYCLMKDNELDKSGLTRYPYTFERIKPIGQYIIGEVNKK